MAPEATANLLAVDIGNSRIKIGQFDRVRSLAAGDQSSAQRSALALPEPLRTFDLAIINKLGEFDSAPLLTWCDAHVERPAHWVVASVHRRAAELLGETLAERARHCQHESTIRYLSYRDVPLAIDVDEPSRVGIDRLLAAFAADRLRRSNRAAIIVDLGSAITVDLLNADGAFEGGAILPGIAMSARALAEQTDALPRVLLDDLEQGPPPLGKSTVPAIQAGLYWGAIGAIGELARRLSANLSQPPDVFVTGGASPQVAELLAANMQAPVRHVPHLVLAGIALVDAKTPGKAGG